MTQRSRPPGRCPGYRVRAHRRRERVLLDGEDVSAAIRTPEISLLTSRISACPGVREALVRKQRELCAPGGFVLEGRDIGTVVFPDAEVKFFLVASAAERGRRRFLELQAKGWRSTWRKPWPRSRSATTTTAAVPIRRCAVPPMPSKLTPRSGGSTRSWPKCCGSSTCGRWRQVPARSELVEIVVAKSAGFCFGVKRATQMAFEASAEHPHICSLGPIIHSPQVVKKLAEKGVAVVDRVEAIPEGAVIIRSHGVTADEMRTIQGRDLTVVDATCSVCQKSPGICGAVGHRGIFGGHCWRGRAPRSSGDRFLRGRRQGEGGGHAADAGMLPRMGRVGIVAQTTQSFENLRQVAAICLEKCRELHVFNTICDATRCAKTKPGKSPARLTSCW